MGPDMLGDELCDFACRRMWKQVLKQKASYSFENQHKNGSSSLHVFQPLHESVLVAVGAELWILSRQRIKLAHVHQTIIGQHSLNPNSTDVVSARCDQHICNRPPENIHSSVHFLAGFNFFDYFGMYLLVLLQDSWVTALGWAM
jgi:hypothetical protein